MKVNYTKNGQVDFEKKPWFYKLAVKILTKINCSISNANQRLIKFNKQLENHRRNKQ